MIQVPPKTPKKLKSILIVGYALAIFTIIFSVSLYFSLPMNELGTMIIIALIVGAVGFLAVIEHLRRKLVRGKVKIRHIERPRSQPAAILLAVIPGLFGLLGIGHIYIGRRRRGACYLLFGLLVIVLAIVYLSIFSPEFAILMGIFAVLWVLQIVDVYRLA